MKKGFTLIELIISLSIFAISMVAISMLFTASLNIRKINDAKQSTAGYSQAIIENFRAAGYTEIDTDYKCDINAGIFMFVYFNDMSYFNNMIDFNAWYHIHISDIKQITNTDNSSTYPPSSGNKFGALIKITKQSADGGGTPYHIYVRVWRLDKGAISQSVRDIYESR